MFSCTEDDIFIVHHFIDPFTATIIQAKVEFLTGRKDRIDGV
jgi:hypothetical protein